LKRKTYKPREGNIKSTAAYDPFPKSGLVKQYEPFIRDHVNEFCKKFPHLRRDDVLIEAVLLADKAAQRFKPELGNDFSTPLRHYPKKLNAIQEEEKGWNHAAPTDWAPDQEAAPKPVLPVGGANGARIALDRWNFTEEDENKRRGIVLGTRLWGNDEGYARGVQERISAALNALDAKEDPIALGRLRAAIDHLERRQREEDAEAEDRQRGVYTPTFLEVRPLVISLLEYTARTSRHSGIFPQKNELDPRLRWEEGWQNSLGAVLHLKPSKGGAIPRGLSRKTIETAEYYFETASAALRPFLSPDERAVMDWLGGLMFRPREQEHFTAEGLADHLGLSKRTIYKIRDRVITKLKKELRK
jgi:hypothetical protein